MPAPPRSGSERSRATSCFLACGDPLLVLGDGPFALLDRFALQLHRSELAPPARELDLPGAKPLLPSRHVSESVRELRLAQVEVARADTEDSLDRRARVAQEELAPLEIGDGLTQQRDLLFEPLPASEEQSLELLLGCRCLSHSSRSVAASLTYLTVAVAAAGRPVLSRRFRSGPPAHCTFVGGRISPAAEIFLRKRVKLCGVETDNPVMDPTGARLLAARIKAGVAVGTRIELVADADGPSGLCAGDRGVVDDINERGFVRVIWDRGMVVDIDPDHTQFRPLAA